MPSARPAPAPYQHANPTHLSSASAARCVRSCHPYTEGQHCAPRLASTLLIDCRTSPDKRPTHISRQATGTHDKQPTDTPTKSRVTHTSTDARWAQFISCATDLDLLLETLFLGCKLLLRSLQPRLRRLQRVGQRVHLHDNAADLRRDAGHVLVLLLCLQIA